MAVRVGAQRRRTWITLNAGVVGGQVGEFFAHRLAFEIEAIGVVHESVEDGVREHGFAQVIVPGIDGELAGDQRGALIVAVIEDLQQITPRHPFGNPETLPGQPRVPPL